MTESQKEKYKNHPDPDVRQLWEEYLFYAESPYEDMYRQISEFITSPPTDSENKMKFFKEYGVYVTNMDTIRKLMNPAIAAEIDQNIKNKKEKEKQKNKSIPIMVKTHAS